MSDSKQAVVTPNIWASLRRHTPARIGLGRSGVSLPTQALLEFQSAHAQARDAVKLPLDIQQLQQDLAEQGVPSLRLHSQAKDRSLYLQRPDLGRRLDADSAAKLKRLATLPGLQHNRRQVVVVIADGLSSTAVQQQAVPMLLAIQSALQALSITISSVCVVEQARVALGDEVGELLASQAVILLVGERPGLSSPDSLGIYYTYAPRVGLTDAARNCISNIRPEGQSVEEAATRLIWLVKESFTRKLSGVALKDQSGGSDALEVAQGRSFLLE